MNTEHKPTDEEILAYTTEVPVRIAAKYLGVSYLNLRRSLENGVPDIGFASQPSGTKWKYSILPEKLYKYKHECTPPMSETVLVRMIRDEVEAALRKYLEVAV